MKQANISEGKLWKVVGWMCLDYRSLWGRVSSFVKLYVQTITETHMLNKYGGKK